MLLTVPRCPGQAASDGAVQVCLGCALYSAQSTNKYANDKAPPRGLLPPATVPVSANKRRTLSAGTRGRRFHISPFLLGKMWLWAKPSRSSSGPWGETAGPVSSGTGIIPRVPRVCLDPEVEGEGRGGPAAPGAALTRAAARGGAGPSTCADVRGGSQARTPGTEPPSPYGKRSVPFDRGSVLCARRLAAGSATHASAFLRLCFDSGGNSIN